MARANFDFCVLFNFYIVGITKCHLSERLGYITSISGPFLVRKTGIGSTLLLAFRTVFPRKKSATRQEQYVLNINQKRRRNHGQFSNFDVCVLFCIGSTLLLTFRTFVIGKRVRKAKSSTSHKYNKKEGGTTANFRISIFAFFLTFRWWELRNVLF